MISRRQFLRGNFSATPSVKAGLRLVQVGRGCLTFVDTVCRSCGDACGEAAIRFAPRLGQAAVPQVIEDRCTGCGDCVSACPTGAMVQAGGGPFGNGQEGP